MKNIDIHITIIRLLIVVQFISLTIFMRPSFNNYCDDKEVLSRMINFEPETLSALMAHLVLNLCIIQAILNKRPVM